MTGAPISLFCFIRCCVLIGTMWASSPTVVRRRVVEDADPYGELYFNRDDVGIVPYGSSSAGRRGRRPLR